MKFSAFKVIFLFTGLLVFANQQTVFCQQTEPINLSDITTKLALISQINKSAGEINRQLIEEVIKRKVNFNVDEKLVETLKKAGANELLIKTIRENLSKKLEQFILYKRFTDNYDGNLEQRKLALEAAKEFVKKYGDEKEHKEIIDYFNYAIPFFEKHLKKMSVID
jgi:hypothetical protein